MKQKKKYILIVVLIGILGVTGISYAIWQITKTQTGENVVTAGCFRITFTGQNDIELQNAYPISNEEGKKFVPYTFTITNECASFASYQVNLEILNTTTFQDLTYMKVMLNDKIENLTLEKETTKTLENATISYKLKTGYLREKEEKTFTLRLWMDYDTPTDDAYMNRLLESKITIINTYVNDLNNKIETSVLSQNERYSDTETFSLHVTSERFPIVAMSEDLETWEELEVKGTDITVEKTVTENGTYNYYFQDEAENVKEVTFIATKIDDQKPIASMSVTKENNVISIDASDSIDHETSIFKYYYSKDGENFIESNDSTYSFTNEYEYGIATTMLTNFEESETKKVYIKVEDEVGNQSDIKEVSIPTDFAYDETADNNLRYIGANPNNYVTFNNELWRIIGVMNNIDDGTGNKESRLKLIRNESIGEYSWDSSASNINSGYGINEWSQADIMKLLNSGYESETIGGSLYWDRKNGSCYNYTNNATTTCDFKTNGLTEEAKEMIGVSIWNIGANSTSDVQNNGKATQYYVYERSNSTGKICSYNTTCNDNVIRTTTWTGKIGLMYPSDYGFATSGGNTNNRSICLETSMHGWANVQHCITNNWLYDTNKRHWLMTPYAVSSSSRHASDINEQGILIDGNSVSNSFHIKPVLYLNDDIKITEGIGTEQNPFKLVV